MQHVIFPRYCEYKDRPHFRTTVVSWFLVLIISCKYLSTCFIFTNSKCITRNKKHKPNIKSATKKTKWETNSIHIAVCLFLFILVYFEFGFINNRNCKTISFDHLQICSNFFLPLIIWNFWNGSMVALLEFVSLTTKAKILLVVTDTARTPP
jgi:hypothetical protein